MRRTRSLPLVLSVVCLFLFLARSAAIAQEPPPRVGVPGGGHRPAARSGAAHVPPSAGDLAGALDIDPAQLVSADLGTSDGQGTAVFTAPAGGFPQAGSSYAVLSSGHAEDAFLPNNESNLSTQLDGLNNSQGNDLVQLRLTLNVPVGASEWAVDFKFLSEEFPEFVGSIYNDAFLIETPASTFTISGSDISAPNNVALDPDGGQVTINSVGPGGMTAANAGGTTYDGATGKLTAVAPIPVGASQITIIFSVTDLGDSIYDTTVFLDNFRFIFGTTVNYTPSTADFPNPERGFYRHTETHSTGYTPLDLATLQGYRQNENITLILRVFYLEDFTTSPISQTYLDAVAADFDTLRQAGLKAVVRFAYTNQLTFAPGTSWPPVPPYGDATEAQILAHLEQLRPLLYKHRDVIAVVQAGFIGIWGEWYYTDHFVADPNDPGAVTSTDYISRSNVLSATLAALPVDRQVQVRTPLNKQRIYGTGTGAASALAASDAHNTSDIARSGHHNDCFLASDSDFGTYADIPQDKAYLAEETKYLAMGGETCNPNPPRTDCLTALAELAEFHWSYLNWDYHPDVRNGWASGGCLDTIRQKLGYRLTLLQGAYDNAVRPGGEFSVNLFLRNDGWAAPYNPRVAEILLRNQSSGAIFGVNLPDDPRFWLADGSGAHTISRTICAPSSLPPGSYDLLLNLPDPEAAIEDRPEYAIRLANDGVWEAATGYNDLGHTLLVDPSAASAVCTTPLVLRSRDTNTYRIIRFAGRDWGVRSATGAGPGPNEWSNSERSAWVDEDGNLHLKIRQIGDIWHSAEVTTLDFTQEGLHRFYVTTPDVTPENTPRLLDNLDRRVIFAPFVYAADNLEVDMEFTRWDKNPPEHDAQYTIQPDPPDAYYIQDDNLHRFFMNLSGRDTTHQFDWSSSGATFRSFAGHTTDPAAQIQQKTLTGGNVPATSDNLRIHINLWLYQWIYLFELDTSFIADLDADIISPALRDEFAANGVTLSAGATVLAKAAGGWWDIGDGDKRYRINNADPYPWMNVFNRRWNPPSDGRPTEIIVTAVEAPPGNNTPYGTLVPVSFPEVELEFFQILEPGNTTLTSSDVGPPLPEGQVTGDPPVYYDIVTNAKYNPPFTVCIDYDPAAFDNEAALGLFHHDGTVWEEITLPGYPDPATGQICGQTDSFSTFAVLESINQPPVAEAGPDQGLECTGPTGATVSLDGSGSSDPDGDPLTFTWSVGGTVLAGPSADPTANVLLANGTHQILLTVTDDSGATATDQLTVNVADTTPPGITALWTPLPPEDDDDDDKDDDEFRFRLDIGATDVCDPAPLVTATLLTPDPTGMTVKAKVKKQVKVKFQLKKNKLDIHAPDPQALLAELQANGGLVVADGQIVQPEPADDGKVQQFKIKKDGTIETSGLLPVLQVTATDGVGNTDTVLTSPDLPADPEEDDDADDEEDDDDDDDDDDDKDKDDKKEKKERADESRLYLPALSTR